MFAVWVRAAVALGRVTPRRAAACSFVGTATAALWGLKESASCEPEGGPLRFAPAEVGQRLCDVQTPALVLDMDAFERNCTAMRAAIPAHVKLRPHGKAHKCPQVAMHQMKHGAVGICVQTVSEAQSFVQSGVRDVYFCNEVVGGAACMRLAKLARDARITVAVDSLLGIEQLKAAAAVAETELNVTVEVDLYKGAPGGRCGVMPTEEAVLPLARAVADAPRLTLIGIQAYMGSIQHERQEDLRHSDAGTARAVADMLRVRGLVEGEVLVTGAGTGTAVEDGATGVFNEVQPGSYAFLDVDYQNNSGLRPQLENALFVLATKTSTGALGDRVIVDAGLKASSMDSGLPQVHSIVTQTNSTWKCTSPDQFSDMGMSDEHCNMLYNGSIPGLPSVALGDKVLMVPGHVDPTCNMHSWFVCVRNGVVEDLWPITNGYSFPNDIA